MQTKKLRMAKHFNNRSLSSALHLHSDKPIQGKNKDKYRLKSLLLKDYPGYLYSGPHTRCKYRSIRVFRFSKTQKPLTCVSAVLPVQQPRLRGCGAARSPPRSDRSPAQAPSRAAIAGLRGGCWGRAAPASPRGADRNERCSGDVSARNRERVP